MPVQASESFLDGALPRIRHAMLGVAVLAFPAVWIFFRWPAALGFVIGVALSFYNFHSLDKGTSALAERIASTGQKTSGAEIVSRLLLRYIVIALIACGIFSVSRAAFLGLVGGLFLPIAGVCCEAVFELYAALRRGI